MEILKAEIDPGLAVQSKAIELGLVAQHSVQYDGRNTTTYFKDPTVFRSRVICAPPVGEMEFDPSSLQNIMDSVLPDDGEYLRREHEFSRFAERGILILPYQVICRKIGTCSITSQIDLEDMEPIEANKVNDLFAETRVLISPSERYISHLHMSGYAYKNFLNKEESSLYKQSARRKISLWDRIK